MDDLINSSEVARILGLKHRNSVHTYQRTYSDMPRPVVGLGKGQTKRWSRTQIVQWHNERSNRAGPGLRRLTAMI